MRKLILFVLILLVLCAAAPVLIGYRIKDNFYQLVQSFPKNNPNLQLLAVEYKQGWLTSEVHLKMGITLPSFSQTIVESIDSHIYHGPLIKDPLSGHFTLALGSIDSTVFLSGLKVETPAPDKSIMKMSTLIDLKNAWHSHFIQSPLTFSLPPLVEFNGQGSTGHFDFYIENNRLVEFDLSMESKEMRVSFNEIPLSEINFSSFSYERKARMDSFGFWTGPLQLSLPQITIKKRDGMQMSIQDFRMEGSTKRPHSDFYDIDLRITTKEILTTPHQEDLPKLGPIQLTIAIKNLSRVGIGELNSFFETHNQPLSKEDQLAYLNLIPKLLTDKTLITENLTINTSVGTLDNDTRIAWDSDPGLPSNFAEIGQKVNAKIHLSIAEALANQIISLLDKNLSQSQPAVPSIPEVPGTESAVSTVATVPAEGPPSTRQQFDSWLEQGYLIKENDRYSTSIRRENGVTWINDKALPSP